MKHVERRHFFVRNMVEDFQISVPHVSTDENAADFFTKPMYNAAKFFAFRAVIMGEARPAYPPPRAPPALAAPGAE